jgi:hypothetical protein
VSSGIALTPAPSGRTTYSDRGRLQTGSRPHRGDQLCLLNITRPGQN